MRSSRMSGARWRKGKRGARREGALSNLERVCDIAADLDLFLDVTFFAGGMNRPSWAPDWMLRQDQPMLPGVC
jgi:hypothetical protein